MSDIRDKLIFAWNRSILKDGISHDNKCILANIADDVFRAHNAELAATDSQQPQLEMPCESDFMAWCGIQHYNQSEAASIYRYIARHIKRVR